jgi:hypothetical protein
MRLMYVQAAATASNKKSICKDMISRATFREGVLFLAAGGEIHIPNAD